MNVNFRAFSKQLFGRRYERIWRSALACAVLYFSLFAAEIKIAVAPSVLFLTATVFTAGAMRQVLGSDRYADTLRGALLLPFRNGPLVFANVGALGIYTLLTKTALVLVVLFAVGEWSAMQILLALLFAGNACVVTAIVYPLSRGRRFRMILLWIPTAIAILFLSRDMAAMLSAAGLSAILSLICLLKTNAYDLYRSPTKRVVTHPIPNGGLSTYFLRYLMAHKNYLINTVGLWAVACFLPFMFGQIEGLNMLPLGLAILTLNTPICVLLSCDPDLDRAVRLLPGQETRFGIRYGLFIFYVNLATDVIFLVSWLVQNGDVNAGAVLAALTFALQSAILSVLLEWKWPLRNWKIESDLLHHPRKYLVPIVMLLTAVFVSMWPPTIWILICAILIECCTLTCKSRRSNS